MSHSILVPNLMKTPWIHQFQKKLENKRNQNKEKQNYLTTTKLEKLIVKPTQKPQQISL